MRIYEGRERALYDTAKSGALRARRWLKAMYKEGTPSRILNNNRDYDADEAGLPTRHAAYDDAHDNDSYSDYSYDTDVEDESLDVNSAAPPARPAANYNDDNYVDTDAEDESLDVNSAAPPARPAANYNDEYYVRKEQEEKYERDEQYESDRESVGYESGGG